ncbi:exosome component 10 [Cephus cinctus]|uniref:Exosome complex component 10 homolog n=1 Tax=Cephus cinctus TaxID=211228 RepID=A0AAJ7FP11_CEPCN|nr:exosome component 10 [Cephus cinctus]
MNSTEENSESTENTENKSETQAADDVEAWDIIPGYSTFGDYVKTGFEILKAGIRAANNLPSGDNFNYYACFSSFNDIRNEQIKKVLNTMQNVIEHSGIPGNIRRRDADEKFELLLEANDIFLDRAGICMDQESGIVQNPGVQLIVSQTRNTNVNGSWNTTTTVPNTRSQEMVNNVQAIRLLAAKNVHRPQLSFKDKIDNSSKPWQPRIKDKPNSLKPLAIYLEETPDGEIFSHPYELELDKFKPPDSQLQKSKPEKYKSLEDTPLIIIEKPQDLHIVLQDLENYDEIAIDLEHHSYRSFQGITCLMQISTKDTDYIIDTLTLRSELHQLNEILTNPKILKVFHGADQDILWLQRDLSLYIVNMFDTYRAAKQLNLPYLSLAYLLKTYCGLDPNKHFQLADWRIRPLPDELRKYAREDTHYLLYIKDILRNSLIDAANGQSNILKAVYDRSTEVCKQVYVKPIWTEDSYLSMYRKSQKMFNNRQIYALKELHKWRDITARLEDDSTGYVLPNHMLLNIAETLPREMQGILACCNPIPPLVRQNLLKLHKIILKAREQPLTKPVLEEDIKQRLAQRNQDAAIGICLYSPHDIPSGMEPRADLPCLLDSKDGEEILLPNTEITHSITVFDSPVASEDEDNTLSRMEILKKMKTLFVSPFERYKRVIPMVAAQEAKEREQQEKEETERLNKEQKEKQETNESINRVHDHFKEISRVVETQVKTEAKSPKNKHTPLAQMRNRKRKRQSSVDETNDVPEKSHEDLSSPVPSLDAKVVQGVKRKIDPEELEQERQDGQNLIEVEVPEMKEKLKPLRAVKRNDKRANSKELKKKGLLPSAVFDYKTVDFSSFQGGSTTSDTPKAATFEGNKKKNSRKRKSKRKKQQWSGK